jgi:hypothetical protein
MRGMIVQVLLCLLAVSNAVTSPNSPLFLWSGQRLFSSLDASSAHGHAHDLIRSADLQSVLNRISGQHAEGSSAFAPYLEENLPAAPEVILAFVNSKMGAGSSSAAQLSSLQSTLVSSASSVSADYFTADGSSVASLLRSSAARLSAQSQASTTDLHLDSTASCETLLSRLGSDKLRSIFSNGVPDVLLVTSDDVSTTNACIKRVNDKVSKLTSGNYVGLFTAESVNPAVRNVFGDSISAASLLQTSAPIKTQALTATVTDVNFRCDKPQDVGCYGPQYLTGTILIGLLIAGLLIFTLLLAVCCVMSVQPPLRFATQRLTVGKEY